MYSPIFPRHSQFVTLHPQFFFHSTPLQYVRATVFLPAPALTSPSQSVCPAPQQRDLRRFLADGVFLKTFFILLLSIAPFQASPAGQERVAQDPEHPRAKIRPLAE